jgi:type II secretory pathway predicted ATPase ExeA
VSIIVRPVRESRLVLQKTLAATLQPEGSAGRHVRHTLHHITSVTGSLVVWSGRSGVGRTVAAKWLMELLNSKRGNDNASDLMFVASDQTRRHVRTMRSALIDLHHWKVPGAFTSSRANHPAAMLAADIVASCRQEGTELLVLKEVNSMTAEELAAYGLVLDEAEHRGQHLNILLLARDGIDDRLRQQPATMSRAVLRCDFPVWKAEELERLCVMLVPALEEVFTLDPPERKAFLSMLVEGSGGSLRHVRLHVDRVAQELSRRATQRPTALLEASLLMSADAAKQCASRTASSEPMLAAQRRRRALPDRIRRG